MSKNITTFFTEGNPKYKGLQIPTEGLTEVDVLDADYLADRELSFTFPSALTSAKTFQLKGKNIGIDIYKGSTITHTWYGDIPTTQTITLPVGATKVVVRGSVTYLNVQSKGIKTLDVTKMSCLEELQCVDNQLTSLDLSKNIALTELYCGRNQLTSLDVSKNVALTRLECFENQFTSLDLSKNIALTDLTCSSNQLTSLDLSKNVALINLDCGSNQLTSLDVSKCITLDNFYCNSNQLASLDLSKNIALTYLNCYSNQLTFLDLRNNKRISEVAMDDNNLPLVYFAEGLDGAAIMYAYPTEDKENNLDDLNAQIWALPKVESANLYIADFDNVIFDDLDTDAIAQANARGWEIINEEY